MIKRDMENVINRKSYIAPMAMEEAFTPNNYIASCGLIIAIKNGENRMQCANPSHGHFMHGYIGSVWVEAVANQCTVILTNPTSNMAEMATSLGVSGNSPGPNQPVHVFHSETDHEVVRTASTVHYYNDVGFYVPKFVYQTNDGGYNPCYGIYKTHLSLEEFQESHS